MQIVRSDRTMEQIVFPVPSICEFLTKESKLRIYYTTERDEQGSKINDFFLKSEDLFNEMNWQKKLRGRSVLLRVGRKAEVGILGFEALAGQQMVPQWGSILDNCSQELLCTRWQDAGRKAGWMLEQVGPSGGDPGQSGKEQHRSSFLRSSRREQMCGGVAETRRRQGEDPAEESSGLCWRQGGVRLGNAARLDLVIVKVFSSLHDSVDLRHL